MYDFFNFMSKYKLFICAFSCLSYIIKYASYRHIGGYSDVIQIRIKIRISLKDVLQYDKSRTYLQNLKDKGKPVL
jgi:hypothetical protein